MRLAIISALALLASAGAAQAACTYDVAAGLNTKRVGMAYPGAEGRAWFVNKGPIVVAGATYEAYGLPRVLGPMDFGLMVRAGAVGGVIAFKEMGGEGEIIYVPVSAAACTFQPYQKKS